ncbi:hypothetical protein, partial [Treponema endosymbiont of Eucomonympha sp.]|uniref:hypothetical protein n=1 Tax=Treponema endosymbiont of Eucomonympha sp. TaxID=1580831 RepID=UPI0013969715
MTTPAIRVYPAVMVIVLDKSISADDRAKLRAFLEKNSFHVNEIDGRGSSSAFSPKYCRIACSANAPRLPENAQTGAFPPAATAGIA